MNYIVDLSSNAVGLRERMFMSSSLNENELKQILQGISIPPQPQIMVDLQMEQVMPDPDMAHIASSIAQDVSLSAAVLKFVNASQTDPSQYTTSIQQAVMTLGIENLANILNSLAVKSELSDDVIKSLHSFWDTSSEIATLCASIATQLEFEFVDEAYALGLFHNAGIPLMLKRFDGYQDVLSEGYQDPEFRLTDAENDAFKTNHSVLGYYLAKSWGLPKDFSTIIAEHHRIERLFKNSAANPSLLTFASILKLAEHISSTHKHLGQTTEDYEWERISYHVLDHLDLTEYDLEGIIEVCEEQGLGAL